MNARKIIFILGSIILALIAALVAVAVFSHKKMESERNQAKTAPARARRWAEKVDQQITQVEKPVEPEPVEEVVLTQSENEIA